MHWFIFDKRNKYALGALNIEHWALKAILFCLPFCQWFRWAIERPFKTYKYSKWVDISNKYMREFQFKFDFSFFAYIHFPWVSWLAGLGLLVGQMLLNVIKSYSLRFRSPFSRNNDYDWAVNILNIASCRLALIISTRKFIKASRIIQNWVEPAAIYKPSYILYICTRKKSNNNNRVERKISDW